MLDLARAVDLVSTTINIVEKFRMDSEWEKVYSYTESLHHIKPESTTVRSRRTPRRFDEGILY